MRARRQSGRLSNVSPGDYGRKRHNQGNRACVAGRNQEIEMKFKSMIVVGATVLASFALGQDSAKLDSLIGKPAPNFSMKDTKGKTWTNSSLKGKVVILDFWASWCGPCKAASPIMEKLYKKYGRKGLVVVGAETLENGQPPIAKAYAKEHGYTYTFTTNNDALTTALGIEGIPAFIIIGKDGRVARTQMGVPQKIDDLFTSFEKTVKPLL